MCALGEDISVAAAAAAAFPRFRAFFRFGGFFKVLWATAVGIGHSRVGGCSLVLIRLITVNELKQP